MKKFYILLLALFVINGAMAQWIPQYSGTTTTLNSVYFTDANTGYAVGDSGIILKTSNAGTSWMTQSSGVTYDLYSVHFPSTDIGYAVGDSAILKTTNGGVDWIVQSAPILNNYHSVIFTDTDTGYVVGGYQQGDSSVVFILKTTNGGNLWSVNYIYGDTSNIGGLNSVHFLDENTGYAVGYFTNNSPYYNLYRSIILKTTNGGIDWTLQDEEFKCKLNSVYFTNPDTGYAVGNFVVIDMALVVLGYKILKTTDGGTVWTSTSESCGGWFSDLHSVYFTDANTGYAVGYCSSGILLKTTDGATEWIGQDIGDNFLNSIYFSATDTGYAVGYNGAILKTTNGGVEGINDHNQTANLLTIYPNPANNKITIETPANGFLSIHNISGQQLLQQEITGSKTQIDVGNLTIGIYFVRMTGERMVQVGKFVKQ